MTDLKHDPEYPYVVLTPGGNPIARLRSKNDAKDLASMAPGRVIEDTTPKPKIPENAQHITWGKGATAYSRRGDGWVGGSNEGIISEQDLIEGFIGDAEVIVLVRKEES